MKLPPTAENQLLSNELCWLGLWELGSPNSGDSTKNTPSRAFSTSTFGFVFIQGMGRRKETKAIEGAEEQSKTAAWVTGNNLYLTGESFLSHLFCSSDSSAGLPDCITPRHTSTPTFPAVWSHLFHPRLWEHFNKPHSWWFSLCHRWWQNSDYYDEQKGEMVVIPWKIFFQYINQHELRFSTLCAVC